MLLLLPLTLVALAGLAAVAASRIARPVATAPSSEPVQQQEVVPEVPVTAQPGGSSGPVADMLQSLSLEDASIVGVGLAVTAGAVQAVEAVGGTQLEQDVTQVFGVNAAAPILLKYGVAEALDLVGVDDEGVQTTAGEVAAVIYLNPSLLTAYAAFRVVKGLATLLGAGEPEPFTPPFADMISEGEVQVYKHNPTALTKLLTERRRALKMAHLQPGTHTVRVRVSSTEQGGPARFFLVVDGQVVTPELVAIAAHDRGQRQDHLLRLNLNNTETVAVAFPNEAYDSSAGYRTLWVDSLWIDGVSYHPDEAVGYFREGQAQLPGQYAMPWKGLMVWALKPESRTAAAPVITRYSKADLALADASSAIFTP